LEAGKPFGVMKITGANSTLESVVLLSHTDVVPVDWVISLSPFYCYFFIFALSPFSLSLFSYSFFFFFVFLFGF
jgi:hypothetical protein